MKVVFAIYGVEINVSLGETVAANTNIPSGPWNETQGRVDCKTAARSCHTKQDDPIVTKQVKFNSAESNLRANSYYVKLNFWVRGCEANLT